jgi:hypothetical protein
MSDASRNYEAHDYAERIRERLPRRHHKLPEGMKLSLYALWLRCGVVGEAISFATT